MLKSELVQALHPFHGDVEVKVTCMDSQYPIDSVQVHPLSDVEPQQIDLRIEPEDLELTPRANIFDQIDAERRYQDERWGVAFDDKNTTHDWQCYMNNQLARGNAYFADIDQRTAWLKTAAIAVAALEAYDRNNGFSKRHDDK